MTSVGIANGMSTTVESTRRPENRYRVRTYAMIVPNTALIDGGDRRHLDREDQACRAPIWENASLSEARPPANPLVTTATSAGRS